MTLAALLEELKEVDAEQSEKLQCGMGRTRQAMNFEMPLECDLAQALIQNSIQRACERREWHWLVCMDCWREGEYRAEISIISESCISDMVEITTIAMKWGDTAAEALLAAYIAAVRGEAKR
jgi:hypothetical protein